MAAEARENAPPPRPAPCPAPEVSWSPNPAVRPVLFLTDETLARLQRNINREEEPWLGAWQRVREVADEGLRLKPEPYAGEVFREFVRAGHRQFKIAGEMAVRWRVTGEAAYAEGAREILLAWATHRPFPGSTIPVTSEPLPGARFGNQPDVGIHLGVVAITVAHALTVLHPFLDPQEIEEVRPWLLYLADRIAESHEDWLAKDCYGHQHYNNHLGLQNMGLAAIGFALLEPELVNRVFADRPGGYFDLVCGSILMPSKSADQFYHGDRSRTTRPGEVYDRYRVVTVRNGEGQGINYSFLQLRGLLFLAEMAYNNGIDVYGFQGLHGETLAIGYQQLAPYLITFDPAYYGDYHAGDAIGAFQIDMYEIVRRRLGPGEDEAFQRVLASGNRVTDMAYALGHHALLLYGEPEEP